MVSEERPGNDLALKKIWANIITGRNGFLVSMMITSSLQGEGTTTLTSNLARIIAEYHNKKILVIDGNFLNPGIRKYFNLPTAPGLAEYLEADLPFGKVIQTSSNQNIHVLGIGLNPLQSLPLAKIGSIEKLLSRARDDYDFVLMDAPPALKYPDALIWAPRFNGTIVVVQAERTPRSCVERTLKEIVAKGGKIIGVVLNRKRAYSYPGGLSF